MSQYYADGDFSAFSPVYIREGVIIPTGDVCQGKALWIEDWKRLRALPDCSSEMRLKRYQIL